MVIGLTSNRIRTVCEILSHIEVETRHFRLLYADCRPMTDDIKIIYIHRRKVQSVRYNSVADSADLIRVAFVPPKSAKFPENCRNL